MVGGLEATQINTLRSVQQQCRAADAHVRHHGITNAVQLDVGANYVIAFMYFGGGESEDWLMQQPRPEVLSSKQAGRWSETHGRSISKLATRFGFPVLDRFPRLE